MVIPKYIIKELEKRATAAQDFNAADHTIWKFLEKHNIEVEDYDILGGCEAIVNPVDSIERIAAAIMKK